MICGTASWISKVGLGLGVALGLATTSVVAAPAVLFTNGIIHTALQAPLTNGAVLVEGGKITWVYDPHAGAPCPVVPAGTTGVDLAGRQLYPGLIAVNSALGLVEVEAVRASADLSEVGDFSPDVESWIAVNPDSELLPVARANGITSFEPAPQGKYVAGQSGLLALSDWTWEQMLVKSPAALHVYWPDFTLNTTPKERLADPAKAKSLADQDKARRQNVAAIQSFWDDARAYAKGRAAQPPIPVVPAWEAMRPFIRGELPVMIHAEEVRQIKSAVNWALTNQVRMVLCGGGDAWRLAGILASNHIPVVFEHEFTQPARDYESLEVNFTAPEVLRQAGVKVIFSTGNSSFGASQARNLPYHAAQAIAYGYPELTALQGLTLYPAQVLGVADRLGSLASGREATCFICDGSVFDITTHVQRLWIAGREVSLASRHTRLYDRYRARP